jgi:large subunit ribosomal protein L27
MAHKKAGGASKNGRDSNSQRLGVKVFGGQVITAGGIILRQRGSRFYPGTNAGIGKDYTIFSKINGQVVFEPGRIVSVQPV